VCEAEPVTSTAWAAFTAFAVFAVLDWISRAADDRRLEMVSKPLATVSLVAMAVALDPADDTQRAWFVAALVFSLLGDVLLLDDDRWFVPGLAAFLVAHVCYVIGFWVDPPTAVAIAVGAAVAVAFIAPIAVGVIRALRSGPHAALVGPVGAYIVVIGAMVASALASGKPAAAVGALLFAASDAMIAWNKFVRSFTWAGVAIMVTYHLGQLGLVSSLLHS
jgi:uncharacterized membrane protein YhhN